MRRILILALLLALCLGAAARAEAREILLYTAYQQAGWGDRLEVGLVDADGELWTLSGSAGELAWPGDAAAQLEYLQNCNALVPAGELSFDDVFDLKGLIDSVDVDDGKPVGAACDAGVESSWAVDDTGDALVLLRLGMSGDDMYENPDPDAQALYLCLRRLFPGVTSYFGTPGMGPAGFAPVAVCDFCKLDAAALADAEVRCAEIDCEAGPIEVALDEDEAAEVREMALNSKVTGKANATMVTGGTVVYSFYDAAGEYLGSVELYRGLLVARDGMYTLE